MIWTPIIGYISAVLTVMAWILTGKISRKMQAYAQLIASFSNFTYIAYGILLWKDSNPLGNVAPIMILGMTLGIINGYNLYKLGRSEK